MRKNLGVKTYLYPQPTLVIATYNEDGSANAMVAAWGSISDNNQVAIYPQDHPEYPCSQGFYREHGDG